MDNGQRIILRSKQAGASMIVQRTLVTLVLLISSLAHVSLLFAQIVGSAQLNVERRAHTATLLDDGKVLIVGGDNQNGVVGQAELLDPVAQISSLGASLTSVRTDHSAAKLADGRVLIIGGRDSNGSLTSTEIYDPSTAAFTAGPSLTTPRSGHSATVLTDGTILIAGGDATGSAEIYDPLTQSFSLVTGSMNTARKLHSAVLAQNGQVLIVGGVDAQNTVLNTAEVYDPASQSFYLPPADLKTPRALATLKLLSDGKVQVIGGDADSTMEVFDAELGSFNALALLPPTVDSLGATLSTQSRAALISPTIGQDQFIQGALTPEQLALLDRADHSITELPAQNQALVAGGINNAGQILNSATLVKSSSASITTDKTDYAPGSVVTITGKGFQPNETVNISLHETPEGYPDPAFVATADDQGNFTSIQFSPQTIDIGRTFTLTATGQSSGFTAQTAFTDAPDGAGTMIVSPTTVLAGSTGNILTFTFTNTAPTAFAANSRVRLNRPAGWTNFQYTTPGDPGYVSVGSGTCSGGVSIAGSGASDTNDVEVDQTCASGESFTITYSNVTAPSPTVTDNDTFVAESRNGNNDDFEDLAVSPIVTVVNLRGSGTMSVSPNQLLPSSTGNTLTFTFTNNTPFAFPAGSQTRLTRDGSFTPVFAIGNPTVNAGTCSASIAQTDPGFLIINQECPSGGSFTITYSNVTAPSSGTHTFTTASRTSTSVTFANLDTQPIVTITNLTGSGMMSVSPNQVLASSTGNTLTFTFTNNTPFGFAAGSQVTLARNTNFTGTSFVGNTSVSAGTCSNVSIAATTSTLLTINQECASGSSFTITYSNVTASSNTGDHTFTTQSRNGSSGSPSSLAVGNRPVVTIINLDGDGTMTVTPGHVVENSTGNTFTFKFTNNTQFNFAAGSQVAITRNSDFTTPFNGNTSVDAGNTTCSNVSIASATGSPEVLTIDQQCASGAWFTIIYSNAAANTDTGNKTFFTRSKNGSAGTLTNLASHPVIRIEDDDVPVISASLNNGALWTGPTPSNNGAPVTVGAGANISLAVTVQQNAFDWRSTCWWFGSTADETRTWVDTTDFTSAGTNSNTFNIQAPGITGQHNLNIRVRESSTANDCGTGTTGEILTLVNAVTVQADNAGPTVTIDQAGTQNDPTNTQPINFTVVFNEAINAATFTGADVSLGGTAGNLAGATKTVTLVSGNTYNVAVSGLTSDGTVIATIPAGGVEDLATNTNSASTSTDNTVTLDTAGPTLTINQAGTQNDPTNTQPINFTVVFNEAINAATFTGADVSLGGTAGNLAGATKTVTLVSGNTYNVAVSGLTSDGTVIATIPAGGVEDLATNTNSASTSTDNTVTLDTAVPIVTLVAPANGSTTNDTTPPFSGVGGLATGDSATVTVKIYSGANTSGTLVQTRTATRDATTGAYSVDASPALALGQYTAQAEQSDSAGNTGFSSANTFEVHAVTTLLYNGTQIVNIPTSITPMAQLSSSASVCKGPGLTITFTLDRNPITGVSGSYSLGTALTDSSGKATASSVSTSGWLEDIYTVTASFAGTVNCDPSTDEATITVAQPGSAAEGGGWLTYSGVGRENFGFTVRLVPNTYPYEYKGQFLLINNGKWRVKGNLNTFSKTNGKGAASGVGDLYRWNQTLNGGLGAWEISEAGATYTISFEDNGQGGKNSQDKFGTHVNHVLITGDPTNLPNTLPTQLKGGNVSIK